MAFVQPLLVRFHDVDFARIVFYPRLFEYCHRTFEDFFAAEAGCAYDVLLRDRGLGFPTVHTEADFRRPFRMGDVCRVVMETVKLGERSVTHRYRLHGGDEPTPRAELTVATACLDLARAVAVPLPEDLRAAFSRHLVG